MTIDKTFDPAAIEARWYSHWEDQGLFRPERPDAEPYTIVIPPPNVTGSLHIGHALDDTLQDVLIRHARLKGKDALWVVGTDHAGIATQMVVERQLNAKGQKRTDFTRDEFIAKVWEWKEESGGTITRQLRRLGASCDWENERFTMDEGFSRAVLKVFVDLYNQKLLYRDKRLVNWDPGLKTAISDLEVETKEIQGKFWHFSYPLADGSGAISVATTRPETMLADMAVAVNPEDGRYRALIGRQVKLPITGRLIPIVADEHADPELGSGAVKITPGHDFNDFEVGKRAGFKPADMLNMLDAEAKVVQTADGLIPADYLGLDRFEARAKVVAAIEAAGRLEKIEDRVIQTPYGDRSGVVIEPWLTDQWYVDAETLAKPAIEAVRSGAIRVVPESWTKTYYNWLDNIQPWCVSRQLWWGHQIPAWYDADGNVFVAEDEAAAQAQAGSGTALTRDPDVLDTWFSSALWPFGTIGWPDDAGQQPPEAYQSGGAAGGSKLQRHYPNDVLISGFDILFFWDARMIMQGIHFMGEVPFKTLYLHGLVRAADGSKMSKSKGNTVDPLGLIDKYGADALRFTLTAMESQGRDIKLDEKRVEGYRNFATKLWNAARFAQGNGIGASATIEAPKAELAVNRWIIAETVKTVQALDLAIADLRYDEAANTIYHFTWASFCDWYIELTKPLLAEGADAAQAAETRAVAGWALDQILVMLHPFMPFITEELWHALGERDYDIIVAKWPMADARAIDPAAQQEIDWLIRLVSEVRAARTGLNVPPGARLPAHARGASDETRARLAANGVAIARLARIDLAEGDGPAGGAAQVVVDEATYVLPLEGVIDLDAERARLSKAIAAAEKERDGLAGRLGNPAFVEKAKPEAVEKARADHAEKSLEAEQLSAALARLG
ncbi:MULTISPECIES: valine--tRNA ligase [unclassified Sphingomonas]|uniref:valine--tRNA ligase n=1 Tax=unclassified Sphingomonas TaxID=196159 RepID=UPI0006F67C51|nr:MULTISPECIES: valine--tRNA ligase [unclassified Sphingomonas]KQX19596.1 valine--tRNA ligase [Sphingomonas sp. Root1294]KQY65797.1 valine--tRNA ligase [Sphingomonas sp. Root50]KRB94897.1 valine--tRNA ligase [Sphingomonas sp. Root720]